MSEAGIQACATVVFGQGLDQHRVFLFHDATDGSKGCGCEFCSHFAPARMRRWRDAIAHAATHGPSGGGILWRVRLTRLPGIREGPAEGGHAEIELH